MKQKPKKGTSKPEEQKKKSPLGGLGNNWIYLIFFGFIIAYTFFPSPAAESKEIGWSFLQDSLLAKREISKITVVNREFAEIYIKKDTAGITTSKETSNSLFSTVEIPKYRMTIGSVENFENKLQQAQSTLSSIDKIDIQYQNRTNWSETIS
ncbi:ATP-dependent metallopeptidase FtsH/Yme1/Tma family protein [uncultured Maribacter sp.]|uniref:ATP-dependent metallopeptidase FtsH/Yme1/Tma family protein n=1 Tax=uncultured Maribacter sp. TaxID=431308 RepID=UPI0030EE3D07|tara:strand:+ start:62023 stop:62478 length:456 start_codon:yes stop_codon:yes gene_type:complete